MTPLVYVMLAFIVLISCVTYYATRPKPDDKD